MTALHPKTDEIAALLRDGGSDFAIAAQLGIDRGTVARHRKRLGLPGYRVNANSPACRHGHPFPQNIAHDSNGWLYCLECSRTRTRVRTSRATQPDEIAIERAISGDPPERLTPRERAAAVTQLDTWQLDAHLIAERVRCHPRTVHRIRARQRTAA